MNAVASRAEAGPSIANGKPVRLLFHIDDFGRGGTETALVAWLNALDRRQFAPALSVAFPTDDLDALRRSGAIPADVPVHVLATARWSHALHQLERRRRLRFGEKLLHKLTTHAAIRRLVARRFLQVASGYDLVCDYDFSLRRIAGRGTAPWLGVSHYSFVARFGKKGDAYMARRTRQYARYAAIAVLTPAMQHEAEKMFAGSGVRVVELPNVIDIAAIRQQATASVEWPAERFVVSVARLDEGQKDHRTLLRAYAQWRARRPDAVDLVLLGDGPDRAALEQLADELRIRDAVHFMGYCANPFPYVRAAEALVLSSRYEGFGMVLGEAMALGTPVLAADCPTGPRDMLDDGRAGLLVPVGDVDAMSAALERLVTDADVRAALAPCAAARIATFDVPAANRRFAALAADLLAAAR
ncbi:MULTISPECIES: glycosyltransferase [Burkholderia]|uniref:glycosyltransferase n=1 Tax=Burkholderia TaxID=32008 RepID=UPI0002343B7F|nr:MULTISPECIES: glycosyltransferase [Burkholderia]ALV56182.1 glycosyl transferase [Burkholderia cenocepacia]AMU17306.1 glycosyl transferase [Burkholderia cenocepacia]AQQ21087.1 glycosyl transferase [Burkholderia cenocepacia]AQQ50555.1 glycosyl transferase [Burkholderia cenocepacia]ARF85585.1 alpha-1,4-N-acetylgalactosamine transferase PglH [Burkholderia cenocepacia]